MAELNNFNVGRYIGIRHRVKKTAEDEARPTQVYVIDAEEASWRYNLETEDDELDWAQGRFPTRYRDVAEEDDLLKFLHRHIKWRKLKEGENPLNMKHVREMPDHEILVAVSVPASYDGLREGDLVAMILGGSGDRLAFALTHRAEDVGAKVVRISPHILKENRDGLTKEDDANILANLVKDKPDLFYPVRLRDENLMLLRVIYKDRMDVMKDRIACEARLRQQTIGKIFCAKDGLYPEGGIDAVYEEAKANSVIFNALLKEEHKRNAELEMALEALDVYMKIFKPIVGIGPMIAAHIITSAIDIRRFSTVHKFKAYCGVHVMLDGSFPRRRRKKKGDPEEGGNNNWQNRARNGFFLVGDQFNRRKDSVWGIKLREYKQKFRELHAVEVVGGKKKYSDGHIHKMATWRTITKFAEYIYQQWWAMEKEAE